MDKILEERIDNILKKAEKAMKHAREAIFDIHALKMDIELVEKRGEDVGKGN